MKPFNHVDARTVEEAASTLMKKKAKVIAGGTDLLGVLKDRILPEYPETIVNIKTIPGLDFIRESNGVLSIGALTNLDEIAKSDIVKGGYKLLSEAAASVASPSIRRVGTLGGNLCQDVRCWYYRYPNSTGGRIECYLKGGKSCYALTRENQYHSIFGGVRVQDTPCTQACPGSVDIPSHMELIRQGKIDEAASLLLGKNPIPAITGRVCPHYCEQQCNRGDYDQSVSIRDIEKYLGDYALEHKETFFRKPAKENGKKIAIIGSGPAGLSAAYYLRQSGCRVTIFERMAEAGGTLNYIIPSYRLPKKVVQDCVKAVESMGVEVKLNVNFGKDVNIDSLKKEYDAVFLATGALEPVMTGIPGESNTIPGVTFLTSAKQGNPPNLGNNIAVIGGGNTAIDAARTAKRLGVKEVTIIYRRTREEMPAHDEEINGALEEGIKIEYLTSPSKLTASSGNMNLECVKMELGEPDASGRRRPNPVRGSEFSKTYSAVISATGQRSVDSGVKTNAQKSSTNVAGIFAGGDLVTGPATVIEAIASGARAACEIEGYLGIAVIGTEKTSQPLLRFNNEYLKKTERISTVDLPAGQRSMDKEDRTFLASADVGQEANRCFNCGCVSVNASDMSAALSAFDARLVIASEGTKRETSIHEFLGTFPNSLGPGEILTEIKVPRPPPGAIQNYVKFRLRETIDFALVSVASLLTIENGTCRDARIFLGAVAPRPVRAEAAEKALIGHEVNEKQAAAAAEEAMKEALPLEKNNFKVYIARTEVERAIEGPETAN